MTTITYHVVEHDGGWAYRVRDVFSETYPTREAAARAARAAAAEHRATGAREPIEYQDAEGRWHNEIAPGDDRPETEVEDETTLKDKHDVQ
ncbi:MAG: DUF2188 domain-containing protein [Flavobacteriaceae bacterium]